MQLDLFTVRPRCEVLAFPMKNRRSQVRKAALALLGMSRSSGKAYWRRHIAALRKSLSLSGFSRPAVDTLLKQHTDAVSYEMNIRMTYRRFPDDAA